MAPWSPSLKYDYQIHFISGNYCEEAELSKVTGLCDAGYFCLRGAKVADPTDNITGGICPKGHYCPGGTYDPEKCPEGTYSNSTFNKNISDCQSCLPGQYCDSKGLELPSGECDPGFFCPGGQKTKRPAEYVCTPGHSCPSGSVSEQACDSGTYQDEHQQATCKICPEGYFCDGTILNATHCEHGVQFPEPCITGHYCLNGTKFAQEHKCPPGEKQLLGFVIETIFLTTSTTCHYDNHRYVTLSSLSLKL